MKFLHTADWHLGVKTNGKDRLSEQKLVLDEILSIANCEDVDCIIVAGDVFNSSSPSAEAEELFFDTIEKFSAGGDRFVLVVAGNHDDPTRLSAGFPLASKRNIAIVGGLERLSEKSFRSSALVKVVETGKGYVTIQKNEEYATIAYLPYPSESRIKEKVDGELSLTEKVKAWAEYGSSAFSDRSLNVFVSHLFLVGGKTNSGEVKVGDLLAVNKSALPKADYVALGHLHAPQKIGSNIYYSGAITKLAPETKQLGVNVFESESGKLLSVKTVELKNVSRYEKVTAISVEDAEEKLAGFDDKDLVELTIMQSAPLSATKLKELRKNFACISSISLEMTNTASQQVSKKRIHLSDSELFKQFYRDAKGFEASEELVQIFLECKGDENETD